MWESLLVHLETNITALKMEVEREESTVKEIGMGRGRRNYNTMKILTLTVLGGGGKEHWCVCNTFFACKHNCKRPHPEPHPQLAQSDYLMVHGAHVHVHVHLCVSTHVHVCSCTICKAFVTDLQHVHIYSMLAKS